MVVKVSYIPNRVKNPSKEHPYVAGAVDIIDDVKGKSQAQVNKDVDDALTLHQSEINALDSENYVTVGTYSDLPEEGSIDTIYRVCNWDGSANGGEGVVDGTVYSQYAWDAANSVYKLLAVRTQIGEVFDISLWNASGGVLATYTDLADALGVNGANVPAGIRKGGMSVKFVHTSDNNYIQFRYIGTSTANADFTNVANWQGVDKKPVVGSNGLVEGNGIATCLNNIVGPESVKTVSVSGTNTTTTGIILKKDILYTIYVKCSTAVDNLSAGLWVNNGTSFTKIAIITAEEFYDGYTYPYTPSENVTLYVRPYASGSVEVKVWSEEISVTLNDMNKKNADNVSAEIKNAILSEAFQYSNIQKTDGMITSASIVWPDNATGVMNVTYTGGQPTLIVYTHILNGVTRTFNQTITYSGTDVVSNNISEIV